MKYNPFSRKVLFLLAAAMLSPLALNAAAENAPATTDGQAAPAATKGHTRKAPAAAPATKAPEKKAEAAPADAKKQPGAPEAKPGDKPAARPMPMPPPSPDDSPEVKARRKEIENLMLEKSLIEARLALDDAKRRSAAAKRNADRVAEEAEEKARIEAQLALSSARESAQMAKSLQQLRELDFESKKLKTETESVLTAYTAQLAKFQKKREAARVAVGAEPKLLKEPLLDGTLYISDRRVTLNGVVTARAAANIIERVNFFNNQSTEYPIFLVIDNSPGGSVAAGFQILKAMQSSKAPVYVVVKGFAASMAAVITTLAERSYCYNNTIILHHQMSTMFMGNMSSLKDQMKTASQWYSRLATPVAKKMGISLEQFTKQMYQHNADGDWEEFGDSAKKLKWVDIVVDRIVETSVLEMRSDAPPAPVPHVHSDGCEAKTDAKGQPFLQLPVLENPFDSWWIYDRRGLYRAN